MGVGAAQPFLVRTSRPADRPATAALLRACFADEPVDALVEALRAGPGHLPELDLVAVDPAREDRVLGMVLLTRIGLETTAAQGSGRPPGAGPDDAVLCLSPLAVHPDAAGRGVARALVGGALDRARRRGREGHVVLEGAPALYRRFGFVGAAGLGLVAPSERIPPGAFQAVPLRPDAPGGRVVYPAPFWEVVTPGLPVDGITHLDDLERHCRRLEEAVAGDPATLAVPVPACPGWTVGDVLEHLAVVGALVERWLVDGRRPRRPPDPPGFPAGWRRLHDALSARPAGTWAATWCAHDATAGFWRRRMLHEHAVHASDVLDALGHPWRVGEEVALDGVDEALRLWLGTLVGDRVGGHGDAVRLRAVGRDGVRDWTVVTHARVLEVLDGDHPPVQAGIEGSPEDLYRWVWGRTSPVRRDGDPAAVQQLHRLLAGVMV